MTAINGIKTDMSKRPEHRGRPESLSAVPDDIPEEITDTDREFFFRVVSTDINEQQRRQILEPSCVYPRQESVLAVHWHPEHVPMEMIGGRIDAMFPGRKQELIIPTQHNEIMCYGNYSGVEVDCYASGFNQKVQLLLHFENANVEEGKAHTLKQMLAHTFQYRSSQLFDLMETITKPNEERLEAAARQTGADNDLIRFVQIYVRKIEQLMNENYAKISPYSIKNKVLPYFFDCLRPHCGTALIDRCKTFMNAVKMIVKANFPLHYFYRASEVIEEARALRAGVVIPHPEQFWPILLTGYDVDGVEVWNPQSHRYTNFLVSVLNEKNRRMDSSERPLLIFMGDDTHMSEKTRDPGEQHPEKSAREIGLQPAWDDLGIRKTLILAGTSRKQVIEEYKSRLAG